MTVIELVGKPVFEVLPFGTTYDGLPFSVAVARRCVEVGIGRVNCLLVSSSMSPALILSTASDEAAAVSQSLTSVVGPP
jgi:hypothetical protein